MWRWLAIVLDGLLPRDCETCGDPLSLGEPSALCAACRNAILPPPHPACTRCGVPLAGPGALCGPCRLNPPAFASVRAAGLYRPAEAGLNPLAAAVRALKYGRRRVVASALGTVLADRWPFGAGVLLVPVPLHPARLRARGFNQAYLLAREIARRRGLACAADVLHRSRPTPVQAGLDAAARRANLRDAIRVSRPAAVAGRHVVLVDDVLTTGATADACARALLGAGATRVDVYVAGRTP